MIQETHLKVGVLLAISVVQTAILLAIAVICLHFDPNDARRQRQVWNGEWPGEDDCERLGFYSNGDPDFLNRLFTECVWDADTQRWERRQ